MDINYCDQNSVCLYICLFVHASMSQNMSKFQPVLCFCYLWPWLGPPLMALRYIIYACFWTFCGWYYVFT